jgi:hypothetical protein
MVSLFLVLFLFSPLLPATACVASQREYDGSCIDGTSGAGSPNQVFKRLGTSSPGVDSTATPSGSSTTNQGHQTMLTISFLDFILLDIIGYSDSAYVTPATSPKDYKNLETSWIDGSHVYGHSQGARPISANNDGTIDLDAVAAKFSGPSYSQGVRLWANLTCAFHNQIIGTYNLYDTPGITDNDATHDATTSERFEFGRFCTVYWLQSLVAQGLLPSFFNGDDNSGTHPQQSFPAYTSGYYSTGAPSGEIPLAAVVGVLASLRASLDVGNGYDIVNDASCLAQNIANLASIPAQQFASAPIDSVEYQAAQSLSWNLPIANYSELYSLLLGLTASPDYTNTNAQNFYSIIHNHNFCAGTACSASDYGVSATAENNPRVATAYAHNQGAFQVDFVSNYHPLALALTFGVVRQAYANDTYNYDIMFSSDAAAMTPPYSVQIGGSTNIFGNLLANACDMSSGDCFSTIPFFTQMISQGLNYFGTYLFTNSVTVWCTFMIYDPGCWQGCTSCDCSSG